MKVRSCRECTADSEPVRGDERMWLKDFANGQFPDGDFSRHNFDSSKLLVFRISVMTLIL